MSVPNLKSNHIGKKIERIRELKGMKQEALAAKVGLSQQTISKIEQSETIDDDKLERIAEALEITADAIKNFNEEAAVNIIANTVNNHDNSSLVNYYPTFNPIDKIVELYDKLLKEKDEIIELYKKQQKAS